MTDLNKLRPHPRTGDQASVMYRAGQIRELFTAIEQLRDALTQLCDTTEDMAWTTNSGIADSKMQFAAEALAKTKI